ncbi:MAG: hypothetical protein JRI55_02645, partial [Deltaproteobacteria bacterium]|nr:hypothetical protein [Deltaproteobacteria bacterium]
MGGERSMLDTIKKQHALGLGAVGLVVGAVGLYVGVSGSRGAVVERYPRPGPLAASPTRSAPPPSQEPKVATRLELAAEAARGQLLA